MTWDEQLLVTASDDGCIFVYDVKDKDAKAAARRDQERMDWAVEVLVTRSELDERKSRMAELEQQVGAKVMMLSTTTSYSALPPIPSIRSKTYLNCYFPVLPSR